MADGGLGEVEPLSQVTDAGLTAFVRRHHRHQPQTHGVGQRLEQRCDLLGLGPAERLPRQRRAAGHRLHGREDQRLRHASILTRVDGGGKVGHRHPSKSLEVPIMSRLQLALNVEDVDQAVAFYSKLFGTEPAKRRPGYANFAIAEPPLKLVLLENPGHGGSLNHLGVEVADAETVDAEQSRLGASGLASSDERGTTCCYAKQDKFWVQGAPDGERWEIYTVLADSATFSAESADAATCCG